MTAFARDIPKLEAGATRLATITHKIDGKTTGFKGSVFLHVDYDPKAKNAIAGIRLSEKGKDGSTLDKLLHAISDRVTQAVREIQFLSQAGE